MTLPALDGSLFGPDQRCFGCAPGHSGGLRLAFERRGDDVVTSFVPGDEHQGPPGLMHGGLVMTLADELGVWTVLAIKERMAFTAGIHARQTRPVRLGRAVEGRGRIARDSSRVVEVEIDLRQDGEPCFRGKLTFAVLDVASAERLLGGPLPDEWKRFAR